MSPSSKSLLIVSAIGALIAYVSIDGSQPKERLARNVLQLPKPMCTTGETLLPVFSIASFNQKTLDWLTNKSVRGAIFYVNNKDVRQNAAFLKSAKQAGHQVGLFVPNFNDVFNVKTEGPRYTFMNQTESLKTWTDMKDTFAGALGFQPDFFSSDLPFENVFMLGGSTAPNEDVINLLVTPFRPIATVDTGVSGGCAGCAGVFLGGWEGTSSVSHGYEDPLAPTCEAIFMYKRAASTKGMTPAQYEDLSYREQELKDFAAVCLCKNPKPIDGQNADATAKAAIANFTQYDVAKAPPKSYSSASSKSLTGTWSLALQGVALSVAGAFLI